MLKTARSIVYIWLNSFLSVIVVIVAVSLLFSIWAMHKVNDEITAHNYNSSIFIRNGIDVQLEKLQDLSYETMYNSVNITLSKSEDVSDFTSVQTYNFTNYIKNYMLADSFLQDLFIYYPDHDYVVGNLGSYHSKAYYLLLNNLNSSGYEAWLDTLQNSKQLNYYTADMSQGKSLFFSRYMPLDKGKSGRSVLVARISLDAVIKVQKWANSQNAHSLLAMLDENNEIYAHVGDVSLISLVTGRIQSMAGQTVNTGDKFIIVQNSKIAGFKYLLIKEKSDVLRAGNSLARLAVICSICSIFIGILLSVYMTKKNNKPLMSLLERLRPGTDTELYSRNEYDLIGRRIELMLKENSSIIQQMERQQNLLNQSFLSTLIKAGYRNEYAIISMLGTYGVSFEHSNFCSLTLKLDRLSNNTPIPDWNSFFKKVSNPELFVMLAEIDDMYAFMLNFESNESHTLIEGFANYVLDFTVQNGSKGCVGVGSIYDCMSGIVLSYEESLIAIEGRMDGIFNYSADRYGIVHTKPQGSLIMDFQKYISARDYEKALGILPVLFDEYLVLSQAHILRCRKYAVINQVLEAISTELNLHGENRVDELRESEYADLLFSSSSLTLLNKNITSVLQGLIKLGEHRENNDESVVYKAKSIIDSTYNDPMLGLYSISETVGVSNSYISRVFKQEYGIGVAKYINKVRVEKAKELIATGNMNIKSVAASVGFSSDISFIRVFKQYEQTTPGKYKN